MKKVVIVIVILLIIGVGFWFWQNSEKTGNNNAGNNPDAVGEGIDPITQEIESVDKYLKANITDLSPVSAQLGGTWQVVSFSIDTTADSGTVVYEDGHIQEVRNFTYSADEKGKISNFVIE